LHKNIVLIDKGIVVVALLPAWLLLRELLILKDTAGHVADYCRALVSAKN